MPLRAIHPREWTAFLERVTRERHPALVSIACVPEGLGVVEANDMPFRSVRISSSSEGRAISVEIGRRTAPPVLYLIPEPTALLSWERDGEEIVEILGPRDTLTLLRFRTLSSEQGHAVTGGRKEIPEYDDPASASRTRAGQPPTPRHSLR